MTAYEALTLMLLFGTFTLTLIGLTLVLITMYTKK